MMKIKSNQSGFTTIELLMVAVILIILASLAIVMYARNAGSANLDSYQYQLTQRLNQARSEAVARNTEIRAVIAANGACTLQYTDSTGVRTISRLAPSNGRITCAPVTVRFTNRGLCSSAPAVAPQAINLSSGAASERIQVYSTGYVQMN